MRGMRSTYPHGPYQVRGWGPPPDPTSQLLGSLGDSLAEGIENLLSLVEQSTSLMRPVTMPMAPGGPRGRGGSRRRHGWEHAFGECDGHHRPDCGCEHDGEKWREHGRPDCGCGEHHEGHRHVTRTNTMATTRSTTAAVRAIVSRVVAAGTVASVTVVVVGAGMTVTACVALTGPTWSSRPAWASAAS